MEDTYVVKLHHDGSIRRVLFPGKKAENLLYSDLESKARQLYSLPESAPLQLSYFDDEDDEITLAGDSDLKDALLAQKLNPLHVFVEAAALETSEEEENSKLGAVAASGAAASGPYYEESPMDETCVVFHSEDEEPVLNEIYEEFRCEESPMDETLEGLHAEDGNDGKGVQEGKEEQEEQESAKGKKQESGEAQCTCEAASSGWAPRSSHWWNKDAV
eukprot:jgi/Mesen1/7454/ME000389S06794